MLKSVKHFLERTTPLGELAQRRREKRGKTRPASLRIEEGDAPPLPIPESFGEAFKAEYLRRFGDQTRRLDYILIWGHGLQHSEPILTMIREHPDLRIRMIKRHEPRSISALIRAVYGHDYAPLHHLRAKTKYLRNTPREVLFIFVDNLNPDEDYFGKNIFRHFESCTIKAFKEKMRDLYNPRNADGARSEDHVIQASDNAMQARAMLQYLGVKAPRGFDEHPLIRTPYHVQVSPTFTIERVPIASLVCNLADGDPAQPTKRRNVPIDQSPQYKALAGDEQAYADYLAKYGGMGLTDAYSPQKFKALADGLRYLDGDHATDYIAVRRLADGRLGIVDGLHRAAILLRRGQSDVLVAVVREQPC